MVKIDIEQITLGHKIVEESINPIIIFNEDFSIVDSNLSAKNCLLSDDDTTIFTLFDHLLKDEKDMWIDMMEENFMDLKGVKLYTRLHDNLKVYKIDIISLDNSKNAMMFIDVTEYARSSHRADKLLELIDENIIMSKTDLNGIITDASQLFCNISGYEKDELIGKSHHLLVGADTDKKVFEELWSTIENGKTWEGVIKNKKKNGDYYTISTKIKPEVNYNNIIYGYTSVSTLVESK